MFPALTSEFIKAENRYRHDRAQSSLLSGRALRASRARRDRTPPAVAPTRAAPSSTADAARWSPRSA